eukprot:m51a1_g14765 hypothetical protein (785) ;mRNA; f:361463-364505
MFSGLPKREYSFRLWFASAATSAPAVREGPWLSWALAASPGLFPVGRASGCVALALPPAPAASDTFACAVVGCGPAPLLLELCVGSAGQRVVAGRASIDLAAVVARVDEGTEEELSIAMDPAGPEACGQATVTVVVVHELLSLTFDEEPEDADRELAELRAQEAATRSPAYLRLPAPLLAPPPEAAATPTALREATSEQQRQREFERSELVSYIHNITERLEDACTSRRRTEKMATVVRGLTRAPRWRARECRTCAALREQAEQDRKAFGELAAENARLREDSESRLRRCIQLEKEKALAEVAASTATAERDWAREKLQDSWANIGITALAELTATRQKLAETTVRAQAAELQCRKIAEALEDCLNASSREREAFASKLGQLATETSERATRRYAELDSSAEAEVSRLRAQAAVSQSLVEDLVGEAHGLIEWQPIDSDPSDAEGPAPDDASAAPLPSAGGRAPRGLRDAGREPPEATREGCCSYSEALSAVQLLGRLVTCALESRFRGDGKPEAAQLCCELVVSLQCAGLRAPVLRLLQSTVEEATKAERSCGIRTSAYWMVTVWHVIRDLTAMLPHGCSDGDSSGDDGDGGDGSSAPQHAEFFRGLAGLLQRLFAETMGGISGPLARAMTTFEQVECSVSAIEQFVRDSVRALVECRVPEQLQREVSSALRLFIDASLFNAVLGSPQACTCGGGQRLKAVIATLEEFLEEGLSSFASVAATLVRSSQLASLLISLGSSAELLLDECFVRSAFSQLNSRQILHVVQAFQRGRANHVTTERMGRA